MECKAKGQCPSCNLVAYTELCASCGRRVKPDTTKPADEADASPLLGANGTIYVDPTSPNQSTAAGPETVNREFETEDQPKTQRNAGEQSKPFFDWFMMSWANFSSAGSSGSTDSGSTGSGSTGSSKFSLGGWIFGLITMLWQYVWTDCKHEAWNYFKNTYLNCLYGSLVALAALLVYVLLYYHVPGKVCNWFRKSVQNLKLNAAEKESRNAEANNRTSKTLFRVWTYVSLLLWSILFVDMVVRRQESLMWIIMSKTWDHFFVEKKCDYFSLDTTACWRAFPRFLLRTSLPESLYRLITESDAKSICLMLVGLVGCVSTVSLLVYNTIWHMHKWQISEYFNWKSWMRRNTATPHTQESWKVLKAEGEKLLKDSLNQKRAENNQFYLELWNRGDYFFYICLQARDFISWILGRSWKLSSSCVKATVIIVLVPFVMFYFFPGAACALTPWCNWNNYVPHPTNNSQNQSHDSFAGGPHSHSTGSNNTFGANGTGQKNTAEEHTDGQTDEQANDPPNAKTGQGQPVKPGFDWFKWLKGNEEAQLTDAEQAFKRVAHFFLTSEATFRSTLFSGMDKLKKATSTGDTPNPAQDQSKSAEETHKKDKPEKGDTEEVKPEKGDTEEVKPEKGDTEEVKPEKGDTEEVKPEKGDTEEVKPEQVQTEEVKPEQVQTEEVKPEQGETEEGEPHTEQSSLPHGTYKSAADTAAKTNQTD